MDLPATIPRLHTCAACVAVKSVHLPHKTDCRQADKSLEQVHIDVAGPMPVKSAGGCEYLYVVVNDHSCVVYMYMADVPQVRGTQGI